MKRFLFLAMLLGAPAFLLGCHYHGHGTVRRGYYVEHRPGYIYIGGRWVVDGGVEHRHYVRHRRFPHHDHHSPPHRQHEKRHHPHPPRPPHWR